MSLRSAILRSPALRVFLLCVLLPSLSSGCSKRRGGSPFDPETGHPEDFFEKHPTAFAASGETCLQCHGEDMLGGVSAVSCASASRGERSCHPGGPGGGHPAGWPRPESHGAAAMAEPGGGGGLASCQGCHAAGFTGGDAVSCFGCHGVRAPHPKAPWRGGSRTHTGTNPGNAPVCALCHQKRPGIPGCLTGTLCHVKPSGHPAGWARSGEHGAAALSRTQGLASCKACHGAGYTGGSGPSCFSCHGWKAPHGRKGWIGGGSRHRAIDQRNAATCAPCHDNPGNRLPPGCFNGSLCHAAGPHPQGWAAPGNHGALAKLIPGPTTGFASCEGCHGSDFAGSRTGRSCFPCHGWNAPHGRTNWLGGGAGHQVVDKGNSAVCARCHDNPQNGLPPGCYNTSLCHGPVLGHGGDWALPTRHGAAAKAAPGAMTGFDVCRSCHGPNFEGGLVAPACGRCHGWGCPHGQTGWILVSHPTVDQLNTPVCAICHRSAGGDPGCYNATLCHTGVPPPAAGARLRR